MFEHILKNNCILYLIIIICIILIILTFINSDVYEHYDARAIGLTLTECGTECTKALNCVGFGYNHDGGKCYLSKTTIIGQPTNSLYTDEYTKLDRRCNKINRILDNKIIDGNTLTKNSIYGCSDGENNITTRFQYANLGASALDKTKTTVFDRADSDIVTPTDVTYSTYDIDWPKQKEDIKPYTSPNSISNVSKETVEPKYAFIESDKEFLGQYMLAHQCIVNVPFYDCLKFCERQPKCAGTEWNKSMIKTDGENNYLYENVCCPKAIIRKVIPRREIFNRGKFYVKKNINDLKGRDNIVITKTDLINEPINNRFELQTSDADNSNDPLSQDTYNVNEIVDNISSK